MDYREVLARRVMGWRLQSAGKWFDSQEKRIIQGFDPSRNPEQADMLVRQLETFGFRYRQSGTYTVCFENEFHKICESGSSREEAITNAAYALAENEPVPSEWF